MSGPSVGDGPIKRSVMIAGHATSISLEPIFWATLRRAADEQSLPLSALVARIDADRVRQATPPNLASAVRSWLLGWALARAGISAAAGAVSSPAAPR